MAKTLTGVTRRAQLEWTGNGEGDVKLRFLSYDAIKDDTEADITYQPTGTQPDKGGPRDLTAAELGSVGDAGAVAKLLKDFDDSIKTAEGIS